MSVINTNYLALVSQNNLTKSQNSLGTAIERLSSGLRINSAKDDAAGQAIANRFTANIKGLTQASRNANDGISIAQTTEGALNEINNNLQRIRELTVQAANGSNSETDLKSIQDEISQRLDEIDRVSEQTQFNGKSVLSSKAESLKVQVGSQDSEVISINLRAINRETLGLSNLNMENQFVSKNAQGESNFTPATLTFNGLENPTVVPNELKADTQAKWAALNDPTNFDFTGFDASFSGFAVGSDNKLYAYYSDGGGNNIYHLATFDPQTDTITVSASAAAGITDANVNPGATAFDPGTGGGGYVSFALAATSKIVTEDPVVENLYLETSAGGQTLWAEIDGKYYEVTGSPNGGFSIDAATVSNNPHGILINEQTYLSALGSDDGVDIDYTAVATALGAASANLAVVQNDDDAYFVRLDDGSGNYTYYAASLDTDTGSLALTDGTNAVNVGPDMTGVNALLGNSNNTLVQYAGKEGYFVRNGTGEDARYYRADVNSDDGTVTLIRDDGQAATNAAEAAEAEIMVDPLSALDKALQNVDSLRSELGAVQNRFQSTIANLSNTINNLSAARSRIEDADYAVEVSNMTRAQILQQAGTSVLAQANQVPQTVLSLLR